MKSGRGHIRRFVLDANALISLLEDRPGAASRVQNLIAEASRREIPVLMSAVNWGEVFYVAWRLHGEMHAQGAQAKLQQLPILVVSADRDRATRAAAIKQRHSLGYADAFAAELAIEQGASLVTSDPEFSRVGKKLSVYALPQHED